jgi:hypothetical protein
VFATALPQTAADALLVDAGPWGGGIDLVLGCERETDLRWPDLTSQGGRLSYTALRDALPQRHGVSVLSGSRTGADIDAAPLGAVIDAGSRGGATVICDMRRSTARRRCHCGRSRRRCPRTVEWPLWLPDDLRSFDAWYYSHDGQPTGLRDYLAALSAWLDGEPQSRGRTMTQPVMEAAGLTPADWYMRMLLTERTRTGAACTQAPALAHEMHTAISRCVVEDLDVVVTVDASVPLGRFGVGPARATARAGPADPGG